MDLQIQSVCPSGTEQGACGQVMRPWGSFSRQCEAFYSNAARGTAAARRSASSRSKIEVAREEHDENVKWAKQPDARRVLEQPRFDAENNGEGTSADEGALESLDAHLKVRLSVEGSWRSAPSSLETHVPTIRRNYLNF